MICNEIHLLSLFYSSFLAVLKKPSVPEEVILARVGEKLITIQDFIRRSEYTIRPDYCRQDNYIQKNCFEFINCREIDFT